MNALALLLCCSLLALASAAAACQAGDISCFCTAIGGIYLYGRSPIIDTCRVYYQHEGRQRYVHVYLPEDYDGVQRYPMWVHLHGVFWATMGNIAKKVGGPVNATDIVPVWDRAIAQFGDQAIFVYPQSTGYAGTGNPKDKGKYKQFWNIPFWHCSVGVCADTTADDIGFIDQVIEDLPQRLDTVQNGQIFLSGDSAGGMMLQALLCESQVVQRRVAAAADILGGIGKNYSQSAACRNSTPMPFLKIQGVKDPFITYDRDILVDGVMFISAMGAAKFRATCNGCSPAQDAGPWSNLINGQVKCINYCAGKPGADAATLCGITTAGHDADHPWPGWVYQEAWRFFNQNSAKSAEEGQQQQQQLRPGGGFIGSKGGRQQVARWPAPFQP